MKVLGGVFGAGVVARIVRGYTFISRSYSPGDAIHLVGFSRAAYTARAWSAPTSANAVRATVATARRKVLLFIELTLEDDSLQSIGGIDDTTVFARRMCNVRSMFLDARSRPPLLAVRRIASASWRLTSCTPSMSPGRRALVYHTRRK